MAYYNLKQWDYKLATNMVQNLKIMQFEVLTVRVTL